MFLATTASLFCSSSRDRFDFFFKDMSKPKIVSLHVQPSHTHTTQHTSSPKQQKQLSNDTASTIHFSGPGKLVFFAPSSPSPLFLSWAYFFFSFPSALCMSVSLSFHSLFFVHKTEISCLHHSLSRARKLLSFRERGSTHIHYSTVEPLSPPPKEINKAQGKQ